MLNIIGEIKNNDTETTDFVKLTATFYDANNRTLGSEVAFTDPTTLDPGQSGPFNMAAGVLGNLNVDEIQYVMSISVPIMMTKMECNIILISVANNPILRI